MTHDDWGEANPLCFDSCVACPMSLLSGKRVMRMNHNEAQQKFNPNYL